MCCVKIINIQWCIGFFCVICNYYVSIVICDNMCSMVNVVYVGSIGGCDRDVWVMQVIYDSQMICYYVYNC